MDTYGVSDLTAVQEYAARIELLSTVHAAIRLLENTR